MNARGGVRRLVAISRLLAHLFVGGFELLGEVVIADGTDVDDVLGREAVLRTQCRVSGDLLCETVYMLTAAARAAF